MALQQHAANAMIIAPKKPHWCSQLWADCHRWASSDQDL